MSFRSTAATPLKKRPPPPLSQDVEEENNNAPQQEVNNGNGMIPEETNGNEKLDLEDDDPRTEEEEADGRSNVSVEEQIEIEGRNREEGGEDRIDGDEIIEEIIEVEEEVEVDDDEEGHEDGQFDEERRDADKERRDADKERHEVVKERRKRKEYEVFVGGLDRDANEDDLRKVFGKVGEITEVRLMKNPVTQKNKGFAFLRFATVEQAKSALHDLKNPVVNGKPCGVAPCEDSDTLFVGNICKTWTRENLKEKLAHYHVDNYEDLTLVEDPNNEGMNRGFAFLDFSSREDALEACKRLQKRGVVFGTDRTARVEFADSFVEPDDEIMSHVRTIFIDGLLPTWDEDRVRELLKKFGKIEKVELARNMPAAKREDFGFITFDTHEMAVACIDGINNGELHDGDKEVKVRARLSRPRQRGKTAKRAQGAYSLARGSDRTGRSMWGSSRSRMESHRLAERPGRSTLYHSAYDSGPRRYVDPRGRHMALERRHYSPHRLSGGRSPGYEKVSSRRNNSREDEYISRSSDFAKVSMDRRSHRDSYSSHRSGYYGSPPRTVSRHPARGPSAVYDNYSYGKYMERPISYRDTRSHDYSLSSGSKRPHSAIEEVDPRYPEPSIRHPRDRMTYEGSSSRLPYSDSSYGREHTRLERGSRIEYDESYGRSSGNSHTQYEGKTSTIGYSRDVVGKGDVERIYSRHERDYTSRDYMPSRSDMGVPSYPNDYPRRQINNGYLGSRGSGSNY